MAQLILCADDFALSRPISEAIVALAKAGKINAISCMAVCPDWDADAALLTDVPAGVQVGLHLVLTEEVPLTPCPGLAPIGRMPGIDSLAAAANRRHVPLGEVAREVRAQFARFIAAMGRAPDFVDGHQHCHLLPGVRGLVLAAVKTHAPRAWVRNCTDTAVGIAARPFKLKAIGSAFHARGLRRDLDRAGLAANDSFGGHYDYTRDDFAQIFPQFLRRPGRTHLVMVHPGAGARTGDSIAAARVREAAALRDLPIADIALRHGLEFAA